MYICTCIYSMSACVSVCLSGVSEYVCVWYNSKRGLLQ